MLLSSNEANFRLANEDIKEAGVVGQSIVDLLSEIGIITHGFDTTSFDSSAFGKIDSSRLRQGLSYYEVEWLTKNLKGLITSALWATSSTNSLITDESFRGASKAISDTMNQIYMIDDIKSLGWKSGIDFYNALFILKAVLHAKTELSKQDYAAALSPILWNDGKLTDEAAWSKDVKANLVNLFLEKLINLDKSKRQETAEKLVEGVLKVLFKLVARATTQEDCCIGAMVLFFVGRVAENLLTSAIDEFILLFTTLPRAIAKFFTSMSDDSIEAIFITAAIMFCASFKGVGLGGIVAASTTATDWLDLVDYTPNISLAASSSLITEFQIGNLAEYNLGVAFKKGESKKITISNALDAVNTDRLNDDLKEFLGMRSTIKELESKLHVSPAYAGGSGTTNNIAALDGFAEQFVQVETKEFPKSLDEIYVHNALNVKVSKFFKAKFVVKRMTNDFNSYLAQNAKFLSSDKREDHTVQGATPMIETLCGILRKLSRTSHGVFELAMKLCSNGVWSRRLGAAWAYHLNDLGFSYQKRNSGWLQFKPSIKFEEIIEANLQILGKAKAAKGGTTGIDFSKISATVKDSRLANIILAAQNLKNEKWIKDASPDDLAKAMRIAALADVIKLAFHTSIRFDMFRISAFFYTIIKQIPDMAHLEKELMSRDEAEFLIEKMRLTLFNDGNTSKNAYLADAVYLDPETAVRSWETSQISIESSFTASMFFSMSPGEQNGEISAMKSNIAGRRLLRSEDFALLRSVMLLHLFGFTKLMNHIIPEEVGKRVVDELLPIYQFSRDLFSTSSTYGYSLTELGSWTKEEIGFALENVLRAFSYIEDDYELVPIGTVQNYFRYACGKTPSGAMKSLMILPQLKPYANPTLYSVVETDLYSPLKTTIITPIKDSQILGTMNNHLKSMQRQGDLETVLGLIDTISEGNDSDRLTILPIWFSDKNNELYALADLIQINAANQAIWFSRDAVFNTATTELEKSIIESAFKASTGKEYNIIGVKAITYLEKMLNQAKAMAGLVEVYPLSMNNKTLYDNGGNRIDIDKQGLGRYLNFTTNRLLSFASSFKEFEIQATLHQREPYQPLAKQLSASVSGYPLCPDPLIMQTTVNKVLLSGEVNLAPSLLGDQIAELSLPTEFNPASKDYTTEKFHFHLSAGRARVSDSKLTSATFEIDRALLFNAHLANEVFGLLFNQESEKAKNRSRPFMQNDHVLMGMCDFVRGLVVEDYLTVEAERRLMVNYVSKLSALTLGAVSELAFEVENFSMNSIWIAVASARLDTMPVVPNKIIYAWIKAIVTNESRLLQLNLAGGASLKLGV